MTSFGLPVHTSCTDLDHSTTTVLALALGVAISIIICEKKLNTRNVLNQFL